MDLLEQPTTRFVCLDWFGKFTIINSSGNAWKIIPAAIKVNNKQIHAVKKSLQANDALFNIRSSPVARS